MDRDRLDAYCGLYCGACRIYQSTRRGDLAPAAAAFGRTERDLACDGCRSNRVTGACRACWYRDCPTGKGYTSCAECPDVPCDPLKSLQRRMPHLVEIVGNLERIRAIGSGRWCAEQAERWTCPLCGKPTWWYETTCGRCRSAVPTGFQPDGRKARDE